MICTTQPRMMYRAICVRSIQSTPPWANTREIESVAFPMIVDCYKYLQETYTTKNIETWHCKMLWPVLEDFQKGGETLVRVAYTDDLSIQCWIQMIEDESEPIPRPLE